MFFAASLWSNEAAVHSSEPLAGLSKPKPRGRPKAVSLKEIGPVTLVDGRDAEMVLPTTAAHEISDDSDDAPGKILTEKEQVAGQRLLDVNELVIFRVPHKHPHMLKRPLQHVDGLSFMDMAVRIYEVTPVSEGHAEAEDAPCRPCVCSASSFDWIPECELLFGIPRTFTINQISRISHCKSRSHFPFPFMTVHRDLLCHVGEPRL